MSPLCVQLCVCDVMVRNLSKVSHNSPYPRSFNAHPLPFIPSKLSVVPSPGSLPPDRAHTHTHTVSHKCRDGRHKDIFPFPIPVLPKYYPNPFIVSKGSGSTWQRDTGLVASLYPSPFFPMFCDCHLFALSLSLSLKMPFLTSPIYFSQLKGAYIVVLVYLYTRKFSKVFLGGVKLWKNVFSAHCWLLNLENECQVVKLSKVLS